MRAFRLSCLPLLFLHHGVSEAMPADRKRPYDIPESAFETGLYLTHQRSIASVSQIGTYLPLKWTGFHSDSLDWKFEGAFSYFSKRGDDWGSLVAAPGFRYWFDGTTNVTPFLRLGLAHAQAGSRPFLAYGADALFQKTFTVEPGASHDRHRFVVAEAHAGFIAYDGIGRRGSGSATRYGFVHASVSYDWPAWLRSWNAAHRKRAKVTLGVENYFGPGRPVDRLFVAGLSLRSESTEMGRLLHKVDLTMGTDARRHHRFTVGISRGF